jgi:hypothetical protein
MNQAKARPQATKDDLKRIERLSNEIGNVKSHTETVTRSVSRLQALRVAPKFIG